MNTIHPPSGPDAHFEALKAMTRLQWMLNFEAVASVADKKGAVAAHREPDSRPN